MKILRRKAYALATILVLLGVAMFGVGGLVALSGLESKISRSQLEGINAYYVADAGMADALWRLNNDVPTRNALVAGTLNTTYTALNAPRSGQQYVVTLQTNAQGPSYADVTVDAQADNGVIVAKRRITAKVFAGPVNPATYPAHAVFTGRHYTMRNGSSAITFSNGDLYARGNVSIVQATVNGSGQWIRSEAAYSAHSANVSVAGIQATNYPPGASGGGVVPGIDFTSLSAEANARYSATAFVDAIKNGGSTVTFPGPITYVNGSVVLNNTVRNKTVVVNGLLVINGSLTISNAATGFAMTVDGTLGTRTGIVSAGNVSLNNGTILINGVLYGSGNIDIVNLPSFTLNGALAAGTDVGFTAGGNLTLNFIEERATPTFGGVGSPQAVEVQHWEEEY